MLPISRPGDETRVGGIVAEPVVELGISRHGRDTAM